MEFLREGWGLALLALAAVGAVIPAWRSHNKWFRWGAIALAVLFTGVSYTLLATTGRGIDQTIICAALPKSPGCQPPATSVAPAQDSIATACSALMRDHGLGCSNADFVTAASTGNNAALDVFAALGFDASRAVNYPPYGEPGPIWQFLLKERPETLDHMLSHMRRDNTLQRIRDSVQSAPFNGNCALYNDGERGLPKLAPLLVAEDCKSMLGMTLIGGRYWDNLTAALCVIEKYDLDQTRLRERLDAEDREFLARRLSTC